jgi:hypothetical protein
MLAPPGRTGPLLCPLIDGADRREATDTYHSLDHMVPHERIESSR